MDSGNGDAFVHRNARRALFSYYTNAGKLIFARRVTVPVVDPVEEPPAAPAPLHCPLSRSVFPSIK